MSFIEKAKETIEVRNKLRDLNKKIYNKNNLQNNILNIMELYDIFSPILKEKYIIKNIIELKCDMELYKLRDKRNHLEKQYEKNRKELKDL